MKQTKKYDFPDKDIAQKAFVHNLQNLLNLADLERKLVKDMRANKNLELNWAVVRDLYSACTSRKNGLLPWIRAKW